MSVLPSVATVLPNISSVSTTVATEEDLVKSVATGSNPIVTLSTAVEDSVTDTSEGGSRGEAQVFEFNVTKMDLINIKRVFRDMKRTIQTEMNNLRTGNGLEATILARLHQKQRDYEALYLEHEQALQQDSPLFADTLKQYIDSFEFNNGSASGGDVV